MCQRLGIFGGVKKPEVVEARQRGGKGRGAGVKYGQGVVCAVRLAPVCLSSCSSPALVWSGLVWSGLCRSW